MRIRALATSLWEHIIDVLYPPVCLNCKTPIPNQKKWLCENCFNEITLNTGIVCPCCGARTSSLSPSCNHSSHYMLAAACSFADPIPALIHYYKYDKLIGIRVLLSALLIVYAKRLPLQESDWIVSYIPLHWKRESQRTFNQSRELAKMVSRYFAYPLEDTLIRIKNTPPQAQTKKRADREALVDHSFAYLNAATINGKNIILIDDVSTSGATLAAATKTLKSAGAKKILALVVAKA